MAEDLSAQARRLGSIVRSTGTTCEGPFKPFFRGRGDAGEVFWAVACAKGGEYGLQIKADGTPTVLECGILKATTGLSCFQTLNGR